MKRAAWMVLAAGMLALPAGAAAGAETPPQGVLNMALTIADGGQRSTLAFDGLAMMTGNLEAQSFFPPGKVADYTGFQYLRDNDPDNMGHNTSFLTRVAENVIYILTDAQLAQLAALAVAQQDQFNLYGYKRFALMKAFRRLLDGDIPSGSTGLDLAAVKKASNELYLIDGQISFDRALLYANIYNSMNSTQTKYLAAMKGKGWKSWPDTSTTAYQAVIQPKMKSLPQGSAVLVMTYAGDLFSWHAGSVNADVYFCPERHGTYYGGFYIKDAPAVGHEGYSIGEQLTATAGAALCDSSQGYVTQDQAAVVSSLVDTQRNNLYAGTVNIVQVRTAIATLLRSLLVSTASSDSVKSQVLALSGAYGELDGEDNYNYATVFAQVYKTLTSDQKTKLAALRKSIMSGTYADGTSFDDSLCTTPFLYSDPITDQSVLAPYIGNTDYLFNLGNGLLITSPPSASPAPALAGQSVSFVAAAAGSNGDALTYTWDFGDGTSGAGAAVLHAFATSGIYTVTVTAADSKGNQAASSTLVLIGLPLSVSKKSLQVKFPSSGSDSLTLSGSFVLPQGTSTLATAVTLSVGAASQTFTVNAKGKGVSGKSRLALSPLSKSRPLSAVKFSATLLGNFQMELAAAGLPTGSSGAVTLQLELVIGETNYTSALPFTIKANAKGALGK
ncbi:MAG: PKD domain-containing protein [Planctomycetota bacterium]